MTKSVGINFEIYVVNCPVNLQANGRQEMYLRRTTGLT